MDPRGVLNQAIEQQKVVSIDYRSWSSGRTTREIIPFELFNNGSRQYVRAFDRKRSRFSSLVTSRISKIKLIDDSPIKKSEKQDNDIEWNRFVNLEIIPHPNLENPKAIEKEHKMTDGMLCIKVRAARAGHELLRLNVDCSEDQSLDDSEYCLCLKNRQALCDVESMAIAPGYDMDEA